MTWKSENDTRKNSGDDKKPDWESQLEEGWNVYKEKFAAYFRHRFHKLSFSRFCTYFLIALSIIWIGSGFYIVDQGNRGVVTRFDAYLKTTLPGPHWHIPYPVENVTLVNVEKQRYIEIGYRSGRTQNNFASVLPEALMLTKDENIITVSLAVQYQIKDAKDYLFNVKNNEASLKQVTESVERGVIGGNTMDYILTEGRSNIVAEIKDQIQLAMDQYQTGLRITSVNLQDAQPPEEVQNAFEDAIRAREDKQRLINEAEAYSNEVIPKARGTASRMFQEAEGYAAQIVAKAKGDTERFDQLLVEYEKAPKITRKRLYLEAKEKKKSGNNKVLVNVENGNSMFYLPLNQMNQSTANNTPQAGKKQSPVINKVHSSSGKNKSVPQYRTSRSKS